jgi:hypothetical protein
MAYYVRGGGLSCPAIYLELEVFSTKFKIWVKKTEDRAVFLF